MRFSGAVLVVVAAIAVACGGEDAVPGADMPAPFFLRAEVSVQPDTEHPQISGEDRRSEFRWWFQDPDHSRSESEIVRPLIEAGVRTWVSHDGMTLSYASDSPWAERSSDLPFVGFPSFSLLIGPAFVGSIDGLVDRFSFGESEVTVSEPLRFQDRDVVVVNVLSEAGTITVGSPPPDRIPAGLADGLRIWFEPATGFVLRSEIIRSGEMAAWVEAVEVDFSPDFEAGLFDLELPEGVEINEAATSGGTGQTSTGGTISRFSAPFLNPTQPSPAGPVEVFSESRDGRGVLVQAQARLAEGEAVIVVSQRLRRDGLPEGARDGADVSFGAWAGKELVDGERRTLAWEVPRAGELALVVVIEAVNVSREDLLRFTASFE